MKNYRTVTLKASLFLILLSPAVFLAQTQPTVKESVEQVKKDFNALKTIFKKKADTKSETETETKPIAPNGTNFLHLHGGEIAENVVYVDADRFGHFNHGKAIVHKGTASAMINADGQFVFPYNTYRFYDI